MTYRYGYMDLSLAGVCVLIGVVVSLVVSTWWRGAGPWIVGLCVGGPGIVFYVAQWALRRRKGLALGPEGIQPFGGEPIRWDDIDKVVEKWDGMAGYPYRIVIHHTARDTGRAGELRLCDRIRDWDLLLNAMADRRPDRARHNSRWGLFATTWVRQYKPPQDDQS